MYGSPKLSKWELLWTGVIVWAVVFTAAEAPFSFAFKTEVQLWQVWMDAIISSIFIIDLLYHFRRKFKIKETNGLAKEERGRYQTVKDILSISVDIIACVPFDVLLWFGGLGPAGQFLKLMRLFRLLRVFKIVGIFNSLMIVPKFIKIQFYLIGSLMVIHWMSCIWISVEPVPEMMSRAEIYTRSFYWAVTTLTTVGYGDITPTTFLGRIITMICMIVGVGIYGLVIGNVSRIFAENARYKEQTREKMNELSMFMKHYHIPDRLQSAVFGYYNHLYSKHLSDNDTKIISDLPQALRGELQIYMNMKLIRNLPVFKYCSQPCLKAVSKALEQMSYAPGDTIIRIGELGDEMYIIGHGMVDVILSDGNVVASLHEGQFFGEAALLKETTRNANVRAQTYCDLYKLDKEHFLEIIKTHPELLENMEKVTMKRSSDRREPPKVA